LTQQSLSTTHPESVGSMQQPVLGLGEHVHGPLQAAHAESAGQAALAGLVTQLEFTQIFPDGHA
jgi:hypothetical protein